MNDDFHERTGKKSTIIKVVILVTIIHQKNSMHLTFTFFILFFNFNFDTMTTYFLKSHLIL